MHYVMLYHITYYTIHYTLHTTHYTLHTTRHDTTLSYYIKLPCAPTICGTAESVDAEAAGVLNSTDSEVHSVHITVYSTILCHVVLCYVLLCVVVVYYSSLYHSITYYSTVYYYKVHILTGSFHSRCYYHCNNKSHDDNNDIGNNSNGNSSNVQEAAYFKRLAEASCMARLEEQRQPYSIA